MQETESWPRCPITCLQMCDLKLICIKAHLVSPSEERRESYARQHLDSLPPPQAFSGS